MKSRIASASDSNISPSLYLSVLSSLLKLEILNNAPDVRPLRSSPAKKPDIVPPIEIFDMDNSNYLYVRGPRN